MFRIKLVSIQDAERQLLASLSEPEVLSLRSALTLSAAPAPDRTPSCGLAYHEVSGPFLDQLFSYAGITEHSGAIGLAGSFAPISRAPELVVFPMQGLLTHVEAGFGPQLAALLAQGEPERFLGDAGAEYETAEELLLAATFACARFASRYKCAFAVRW